MITGSLKEAINRAREASHRRFGKRIFFYAPSFIYYENEYYRPPRHAFPSISITGRACSLRCKHCGGKLLRTMIPAETPQKLMWVIHRIRRLGAHGCLISGGCLPDGSVPLNRFIDPIREAKRLGLKVVVHSGLIDHETAEMLKEAGVDAVSIDIIGSDETIREIYNLEASTRDYEDSLRALSAAKMNFTPHVLVGLHYGKLKGEIKALEMISKYNPSALIVIVFFPIRGTVMENVKPPPPEDTIRILVEARFMMPDTPIVLGCARPKGRHRIEMDALAVEAGVNGIAFPEVSAVKKASDIGLRFSFSPLCCSQIYEELNSP